MFNIIYVNLLLCCLFSCGIRDYTGKVLNMHYVMYVNDYTCTIQEHFPTVFLHFNSFFRTQSFRKYQTVCRVLLCIVHVIMHKVDKYLSDIRILTLPGNKQTKTNVNGLLCAAVISLGILMYTLHYRTIRNASSPR